jgi:ribosome-binding ATPase YchF (GTP1/OBG family)
VSSGNWSEKDWEHVAPLHLLTAKQVLYVLNMKSDAKRVADEEFQKLLEFIEKSGSRYVVIDIKTEEELKAMGEYDKKSLKNEMGLAEGGIENLIREGYALLELITFFTTGEKETRGWTISRGSTAPVAGAAIHTDFRDKFIRAEVIFWKDLIEAGSRGKAREKGLLRTEGREYVVKDGDVIEFKI